MYLSNFFDYLSKEKNFSNNTVVAYRNDLGLAILHADRGMRVAVVNQRQVFDAFSSGSPDPTAIKMLMMMLRDRATNTEDEPKYLTLMGDGTFLNRNLHPDGINIITFQSSNSESTVSSYVTDDYFGLLEDGMGESPGDKLAIGVGRIPATDLSQALGFVSKVETYLGASGESSPTAECEAGGESSIYGSWRNRIIFVTDDQDGNNNDGWRHMSDSEVHSLNYSVLEAFSSSMDARTRVFVIPHRFYY